MITFQKNVFKTVLESTIPILFLSRLAGVCNITITRHIEELGRSKSMLVIQIIILFINVAHLGFIPYAVIYIEGMPEGSTKLNDTLSHTGSLSSQKFITKMTSIVLISIMSISVRISNTIQMPKYLPAVLDELQNVDRVMPLTDNRDFKINVILSVVLVLVSWPYQIYSILIVTTDSWIAFLMFYLNLYNNFTIISSEFQFVSLCWMLQTRFRKLNQNLEELISQRFEDNNGDTILVKLHATKKCSRFLTNAFSNLNILYGFQLLVILSGLSLNVLFGLYFSIFGGFTKNSNKTSLAFQRISNILNELLWCFYYLARFVFVCVVAEVTTKTANTPRKIICNILDKTTAGPLQQKLWIFLSYTTANKMVFSASNFFRINKALITSAVSIGTTYLVILAQFQKR